MARILVIDDEPGICRALEKYFKDRGNEVRTSSRAETGLTLAQAYEPDVVILDVRLPGMDGIEALGRLREQDPALPVVVVTAYGTMETAVEAVRRGAWDFVMKPLDLADMAEVVERAVLSRRQADEVVIGRARTEAARPGPRPESAGPFPTLVGRTRAMQEVFKRIGAVSLSNLPVLLVGESGTGKHLAARAIHAASGRAAAPFEAVSCQAIEPGRLGAEILGEAGEPGRLHQAGAGTLYLDDVTALPGEVQDALARALQGGVGEEPVHARVVAASQTDLEAAVKARRFREELFWRLRPMTIELPPLRERAADIPALVAHFLSAPGGPRAAISREALRAILAWSWPGNVRELRAAVEHAVVLARGKVVLLEHLPDHLRRGKASAEDADALLIHDLVVRALDSGLPPGDVHQAVMDRFEAPLVAEILKRTGGNQVQAAKLLGIHRTTLRAKIAKYSL